MHFVQIFNAKSDISQEQMADIYRRLADGWQKAWPSNKLIGFFRRKWGVGAQPDYLAIWELPNAAAMDEWDESWERVKDSMLGIEDEFWNAVEMVETKLMEQVDLISGEEARPNTEAI